MLRIDIPFDPVIRRAVTISLQGLWVFGLLSVELRTLLQYFADAINLRTMGVFRGLALGMVLAVHCRPFFGLHTGGEP